MLVSVIIPAYNHAEFITEAVNSVLSQTVPGVEIIVVNDGSEDNTEEVLLPRIARNEIKYVRQPNQGQASARNKALSLATGEFVAFLDDDDFWPQDKLAWQVRFLQENPAFDVIAGAVWSVDLDGKMTDEYLFSGDRITFEELITGRKIIWSPGQCLVRRGTLEETGGFDTSIWGADDFDLWLRLAKVRPLGASDKLALKYRRHATNASNNSRRMLSQVASVIERHLEQVEPADWARYHREAYRWLYNYLGVTILKDASLLSSKGVNRSIQNIWALRIFLQQTIRNPSLAPSALRRSLSRKQKCSTLGE